MAQSLFKSFSRNQLATKAQSFPRKSSNTTSPMIVHHTRDFTQNQGGQFKFPPPKDSDNQIPSSPGQQRCQMPVVC